MMTKKRIGVLALIFSLTASSFGLCANTEHITMYSTANPLEFGLYNKGDKPLMAVINHVGLAGPSGGIRKYLVPAHGNTIVKKLTNVSELLAEEPVP